MREWQVRHGRLPNPPARPVSPTSPSSPSPVHPTLPFLVIFTTSPPISVVESVLIRHNDSVSWCKRLYDSKRELKGSMSAPGTTWASAPGGKNTQNTGRELTLPGTLRVSETLSSGGVPSSEAKLAPVCSSIETNSQEHLHHRTRCSH